LPDDYEIMLNDVPADRVVRQGREVFPFETEFYAGDIRIAVVRSGRVLAAGEFEIDPDIAKVTREEYATLISEIARSTLALYRLGAVTVPAAVSIAGMRSYLVTLDLIRSNFDSFERSVTRVADQPVRALRSTRVTTDIMSVRRFDERAIGAALQAGRWRQATTAESRAAPRLVAALGGRWVPDIAERRSEERLDLYENRALLGFIRWLDATIMRMARRLTGFTGDVHPATVSVLVDRLARWRMRLAALSRRSLFANLTPDPSLYATSVFRMHPDYASAFSAMTRMKSGLGGGGPVTPAVPIDRTYALYEIWCYVGLLHAAAERFPSCLPSVAHLLKGCAALDVLGTVLAQGNDAQLSLGDGLTLTYQRRFGPTPSADGSKTLLIEAIPDITLARNDDAGRCKGLVIFDPKYRAGASLMDGIRDLHVYRDAILGADGERLIVGAVALAPRPEAVPGWNSDELATIAPAAMMARPGHDPLVFQRALEAALRILP